MPCEKAKFYWPTTLMVVFGSPNKGGQKRLPPHIKTVNMIKSIHIPKRERRCTLRDVDAMEPDAPKYNPWSSGPITFDRKDRLANIR